MTTSAFLSIGILLLGALSARFGGPWLRVAALGAFLIALAIALSWSLPSTPNPADRLGVVLAVVALGIGFCAATYAARQFRGEVRGGRLLSASLLVVAGVIATDEATTLGVLLAAWLGVSIATIKLLEADSTSGARRVARTAARWFALADGVLLLGVVVALLLPSGVSLQTPVSQAAKMGAPALAVLLLASVAAALGRAGVSSGRSWVTATVAVPAPVSALLHAGVVNAGAVLLLRMEQVTGSRWILAGALVPLCGLALVVLAPRIHRRVDLKGQLAASTIAQMAFMFIALGLGWPLLALTHLVGHGIYKAGRFMAAGGATRARAALRRRAPSGIQLDQLSRISGVVGIGAVSLTLGMAIGPDGFAALAVIGPATGLVWWSRTKRPLRSPVLSWALLCIALLFYGGVVAGSQALLGAALPTMLWRAPWWSLAGIVALVVVFTRLPRFSDHSSRLSKAESLHNFSSEERAVAA